MTPLVSVIVFTYNQEHLLSETLNSIVSQNFPIEQYEVLIGEDCSQDQTALVAQNFAQRYPHVFAFCHPKNLGILKNYMYLLDRARGKYIMVCAGDDYWLPGKMQIQTNFMEQNQDVALLYGNFLYLKNGILEQHQPTFQELNFESLLFHNPICAPSTCWRRTFWEKFKQEVQPEKNGFTVEDWPLWLYLSLCGKIHYLNENFCVYRVQSGSASHQKQPSPEHLENFLLRHQTTYEITRIFGEKFSPDKMPWIEKEIARRLLELYWRHLMHHGLLPKVAKEVQHYAKMYPDLFTSRQKLLLPFLNSAFLWNNIGSFLKWWRKN